MDQQKAAAEKKIINIGELLKKPYQNEFETAAVTGRRSLPSVTSATFAGGCHI
jgi:hypothetical protein